MLTRFDVPGVAGEFDLLNRPGLRLDSGFEAGNEVGTHYDAMLAKVIAWAPTRVEAARKLADALSRAQLHGVTTNRELLVASLRDEAFLEGDVSTDFFERRGIVPTGEQLPPDPHLLFAAAVALAEQDRLAAAYPGRRSRSPGATSSPSPSARCSLFGATRSTSSSGTAAATATPHETVTCAWFPQHPTA